MARIRFTLLLCLPSAVCCSESTAQTPTPVIFSSVDSESERPLYSLALPHGWQRVESSKSMRNVTLYRKPTEEFPYLFVRRADPPTSDDPSPAPSFDVRSLAQVNFLESNELKTSFYDIERNLVWSRQKTKTGTIMTDATFLGDEETFFRFFCIAVDDHDFQPTMRKVIKHVRLYNSNATVDLPQKPADMGVPIDLFAPPGISRFNIYLGITLAAVILVLYISWKAIAKREHAAVVAEVDRARDARNARRKKVAHRQHSDARDYVQQVNRVQQMSRQRRK